MTVRSFVISAALTIFCWLAATFLRAVPMETYPAEPSMSSAVLEESTPRVVATSSEGSGAVSATSVTQ